MRRLPRLRSQTRRTTSFATFHAGFVSIGGRNEGAPAHSGGYEDGYNSPCRRQNVSPEFGGGWFNLQQPLVGRNDGKIELGHKLNTERSWQRSGQLTARDSVRSAFSYVRTVLNLVPTRVVDPDDGFPQGPAAAEGSHLLVAISTSTSGVPGGVISGRLGPSGGGHGWSHSGVEQQLRSKSARTTRCLCA